LKLSSIIKIKITGLHELLMFSYQSSSIDWCEQNYVYSNYIVEFWNTITNIFVIILGFSGLYLSSTYEAYNLYNDRPAYRYKVYYTLLIFIGVGSSIFHGTLSQFGQILDEGSILAMIFFATMCESLLHAMASSALACGVILCWYYNLVYTPYLLFLMGTITFYLIQKKWKVVTQNSNKPLAKEFYLLSVLTFICAFCCWIIDQICVFSFQFHALWHILSGLSIYTILLVECYALSKNSVIKYYGIIPYIYHPNAKKQLFRNKTKSD
jgi:dihydroceramidase